MYCAGGTTVWTLVLSLEGKVREWRAGRISARTLYVNMLQNRRQRDRTTHAHVKDVRVVAVVHTLHYLTCYLLRFAIF